MRQLLRNLRLAARTAAEHLIDDPIVLILQVSRRLPQSPVQRMAGVVRNVSGSTPSSVAFLVACQVTGNSAALEAGFGRLLAHGVRARAALRAADVALAAGRPDWADQFLSHVGDLTPGRPAVLARRRWYDGDMSGALAALGRSRASAQRRRLASELRVYEGAAPRLTEQPEPVVAPEQAIFGIKPAFWVPKPVSPRELAGMNRDVKAAQAGRVLHLLTNSLPHTASGYAQRSHSILTAQQQAGWQTLAVTRLGYPVQVGKLQAKELDVVDGVPYGRLLPARLAPTADGRLQQQAELLLDLARRFEPDVLHTTTHFVNAVVAREVARALDIPWVYEVRGQLADTWAAGRGPKARDSERYRLFQDRETEAMASADLVVTLGESMKQSILERGISADKVVLTPNAVGGAFLQEPGAPAEARRQLGLEVQGPFIGTVSSLVDYEGLDDLVAAFALLAPAFPQLKLLVVGAGVAGPALQEQVRNLGLADRAVFPGRVPRDLTPLYHQALDVFVVPRKDLEVTRSVTPLKPVEALASARPVVGSDLPALRELVLPGRTGMLVPAERPGKLAEALAVLLEDSELRLAYGAAGREWVLAGRTWNANAQTYLNSYNLILKEHRW
ncbi:MAG: glycosyltransferase WbuB [Micrococcaceae bacterium]|nr:glycosyltransferase WbuB [Micrococcaceae bacterium]